MRKFRNILIAALLGFWAAASHADTFHVRGETVTGELLAASANDQTVQVKVGEGEYKKVPWGDFSQEDLRQFRDNPKLSAFVQPFIEESPEERVKKTEVPIKQPSRLERPKNQSMIGAMFTSPLGLAILVIMWGAIIYAGYEVAIFRAQPVPLVAGLSAIPFVGFLAPIVFMAMPMRMQKTAQPSEAEAGSAAPGTVQPAAGYPAAASETVNPMQGESLGESPEHHGGLHLDHAAPASQPPKQAYPAPTVFQRGQFTFNRRFIETKFAGFLLPSKREADKDMVLVVKAVRGTFIAERIAKLGPNEMSLQVNEGGASHEVVIPFTEIREIILKHRDAA